MYAVSSVTSRNGIDGDGFSPPPASPVGENTVNYRYEGAWSCLDGRGFMGFKAVETTDATSGIITRTEYESSTPLLAGRVKHTEQRLIPANIPIGGSALISQSDTTWNVFQTSHPNSLKTFFVAESFAYSYRYEVNRPAASALVATTLRHGPVSTGGAIKYDSYGNLLESSVSTTGGDAFRETVTNTYSDTVSSSQWHLGRLATSTVTKTGPNPLGGADSSLTRSSSFAYHPTTGLLTQEVIEPSGGLLRQQKDYTHDGFGNILTSTITDERSASTTAQRTRYIHKDHLGSVDVITDSAGAVVERQSFDAWGRRRTVAYNSGTSTWSVTYPATPGSAETHRGFTGHEMLDAVGLVHMGGRIYDPITARFLSPDPFVQSPDNLQNLNRYSYVLNNPLSFTDPSGFFFKSLGKFLVKAAKTLIAHAIGTVVGTVVFSAVFSPLAVYPQPIRDSFRLLGDRQVNAGLAVRLG